MKETVPTDHTRARVVPPQAVAEQFSTLAGMVSARSQIVWGEHCSECDYPACYASCAFYTPRGDFHCRRFARGIEPLQAQPSQTRLHCIRFRKWGKLEGRGPAPLRPVAAAQRAERLDTAVHAGLTGLPVPYTFTRSLGWRWNERKLAALSKPTRHEAEAFVLEAWASDGGRHPLTLTFLEQSERGGMFQTSLVAGPQYARLVLPAAEIAEQVDLASPWLVQIEPLGDAEDREIVFGLCDFVAFRPEARPALPAQPAISAKVVVWDLDETVWNGILVEDGAAGVEVRPEAMAAIKALDERGILQSAASKNDSGEAIAALDRFGLLDYFLHPQICWTPKSDSVRRIAAAFGLGLDSLVFIDDQPFERAEVHEAHPTVRVLADTDVSDLLHLACFDVPITDESRRRRAMYHEEAARLVVREQTGTDYVGFLRNSGIVLELSSFVAADRSRVHELSQRTNQLNFNGAKLSLEDLDARLRPDADREHLVLRCADRFGDYGLIGFATIDLARGILDQVFMSCRTQRKRVEHAFFAAVARRLAERDHRIMTVRLRRTGRNEAAFEMLRELGFKASSIEEAEELWAHRVEQPFEDADVVRVVASAAAARAA